MKKSQDNEILLFLEENRINIDDKWRWSRTRSIFEV